VHVIEIELAVTVPVQLWGPLRVILPSLVTVPVKPLNGCAVEIEQSVCVTTALCPMRDASQWPVMFQVPARSGQAALPPSGEGEPEGDELELHALRSKSAAKRLRVIGSW